ncbi:MAG: restriction endonuclease subunit S [Prevotella sp.]|jgi:type I restriction enzyme S subunit|nr:restriction endonuclease subunit S [Prevotella sp.]
MGKWKEIRISEIGPVFSGSTPSTANSEFWDGEYVWITPADLSMVDVPFVNSSSRKLTWLGVKKATNGLLPENCVIISCRAPVGYCAVVSCDFSFNQGCKAIMPYEKYDSLYLYYSLKMYKGSLERVSSGTTFLELPKRELDRFKISIPLDTKEQSKIAEILSTIDTGIEKTKAIVEKYKRIKTGMMQDLLVNGIDEKGNIRSQKDHKYKDSPIGKMPIEWEENRFDKIAKNITTKTKTMNDCINMDSIESDTGILLSLNDSDIKSDKTVFKKGDILFGKLRPYLRKYWYAIFDGTCSSEIMVFRPDKYITSLYLYYLVSSEGFVLFNDSQTFGTRMPRTGWAIIKEYQAGIPEIDEQDRITDKLLSIDAKIQSEQAYLKKLQGIKQGLMRDLLTNKVAVDALL